MCDERKSRRAVAVYDDMRKALNAQSLHLACVRFLGHFDELQTVLAGQVCERSR
jgi:hypothetical protein